MSDDRPVEPVSSIRTGVDSTLSDAGFTTGRNLTPKGGKPNKNFDKMLKDARDHKSDKEEQE